MGTDDRRRRRFEGPHRGRRGRFQLQWFRSDPGASRGQALRFLLQFMLASAALAVAVLAFFPLAWERQANPCAAVEALVWRRTTGAMQVRNGARSAHGPERVASIVPDGPLPQPIRCAIAYWRRI
ncbi:hypothetical protein KPL78_28120 [Roseomonas sp. HJA6]|uniref:Uncharacterized protein n=1 Tax=Roseomonas alba TaxID=2846776 RepID=A0ABS7AHH2_9PROT|nr:hypothetical protein [Neoroseomonas alba]MBW6401752.1 hypothetical protein [Neoroseomonas alba]